MLDTTEYTAAGGRAPSAAGPPLPRPRGPLSGAVLEALTTGCGRRLRPVEPPLLTGDRALSDEDLQLALYAAYELHYRGFAGVAPAMEWDPDVIRLRARLEALFLAGIIDAVGPPPAGCDARAELVALATSGGGPSLSDHVARTSGRDELAELCIHRSAYQLKEADPHTWALPRLAGAAKAVMAHIQHDEYGAGSAPAMHSALFAATMDALGLDPSYGHYLDVIPGVTLATVNLISMLGLNRQWRNALVGHLALFEMTSVGPMSRYSRALERLGLPPAARAFYDVHVEADAEHMELALDAMVAGLLAGEPEAAGEVVFGARALTELERRFTSHVLGSWAAGRSSLLAR
ncbi:MAG TPA: iron-containing redox enzyme family protein [Acidimicrobiales bacterium]|nr:iron-containing redox enzyme family protein [Acidimicrobiales bacterium]